MKNVMMSVGSWFFCFFYFVVPLGIFQFDHGLNVDIFLWHCLSRVFYGGGGGDDDGGDDGGGGGGGGG